MKKISVKTIAIILCAAMCLSMTGCTELFSMKHGDGKDKEKSGDNFWDSIFEEEPEISGTDGTTTNESEPKTTVGNIDTGSYANKIDDRKIDASALKPLTYPDHVATTKEIHPDVPNGTVTGQDAIDLLNQIELEIIHDSITDYVDTEILFENPEKYGLNIDKITWGEISYDSEKDKKFYEAELSKLYTIDRNSLSGDDLICYDKMKSDCELTVYMSTYSSFMFYEASLNALTGPQCEVLFILDVLDFETKEDAENYLKLLVDIDRYYDDLCYFEELRAAYGFANSPSIYEQVAKSFDSLVSVSDNCFLYGSFEERLNNISGLTDSEKTDLITRHNQIMKGVVFPEFAECADRMRALKEYNGTDKGMSEYKGGDAYYAAIFEQLTNSNKTVSVSTKELETITDSVMSTYKKIIQGSDRGWINDYLNHDYSKGDTKANLDYLEGAVKNDFPELHEHQYHLTDVPKELEENFSPAAFLGYHLDNYNSNVIITNNGSVSNDFGVTCAHEGYPGHMFQSVYTRSATKHPYMYIFDSTGYAEGWATYAENYSMKYFGNPSSAQTVTKIENELNVLLMARCDIGIHTENWTADDCAKYFSKVMGSNLNGSDLQDMYDLLVLDPGYAIKYGVGFINTGLVMQEAMDKFPNKTDKEIHTAYLNALTGTFEQIKENMFAELSK